MDGVFIVGDRMRRERMANGMACTIPAGLELTCARDDHLDNHPTSHHDHFLSARILPTS